MSQINCHRQLQHTRTHTHKEEVSLCGVSEGEARLFSIDHLSISMCRGDTQCLLTGWAIRFALVPHTDNNTHQNTHTPAHTETERVEYLSPERISIGPHINWKALKSEHCRIAILF